MTTLDLYRDHLTTLDRMLAEALEAAGSRYEAVLFHAGRVDHYHADDREITFWSTPHFRRWCPLPGKEHVVLARPGRPPRVIRVRPRDYWYDCSPPPPAYWQEAVDFDERESYEAAVEALALPSRVAYVGNSPEAAEQAGIAAERNEPPELMAALDWFRAYKTPWEVALVQVAVEKAASGHLAGRELFDAGASEREIYWAFLEGSDQTDKDLPFDPICAFDDKASVLHYENRRGLEAAPGKVLLLDAGAGYQGYASDLTRTWVGEGVEPVFAALVEGVDRLERDLVAMVTPGRSYPEIHGAAQRGVADLLVAAGVLHVGSDEALARDLVRPFFPHGVGHHLGIQVHDVGGRQGDLAGSEVAAPDGAPHLRTTRPLEVGHLVTIEPGIYFAPVLLDELAEGPNREAVDWALVDRLRPCGGIRIEDDVLCTEDGAHDLSREHLPGPND
ncbi:MAG: Xaa-Pro dipeptidase [Acidobacteriota bacterium]